MSFNQRTFGELDRSSIEHSFLHEEMHQRTNIILLDFAVRLIVENQFGEELSASIGACRIDV